MEVVVTTGPTSRAKIQSNRHHQQTNTQLFTGGMHFLSPNQQCQSTEGKARHLSEEAILQRQRMTNTLKTVLMSYSMLSQMTNLCSGEGC